MTPEEAPLDLDGLAEAATRPMFPAASCCSWPVPSHYGVDGTVANSNLVPAHEPVVIEGSGVVMLSPSTVLRLIDLARLGVAWQEAETALPEGWRIERLTHGDLITDPTRTDWMVTAGLITAGTWRRDEYVVEWGPTPTATLQALAAKLREADR